MHKNENYFCEKRFLWNAFFDAMMRETRKPKHVSVEKRQKNKGAEENMDQSSVKERILEATIVVFNQKGLKSLLIKFF